MDKFAITGPTRLEGKVRVEGSKNAALPIIAGALLIRNGESIIRNVPPLRDIYTIIEMLEYLGAAVTYDDKRMVMTVNARNVTEPTAPYELMRKMRASFLVLGPLLARLGEARISLPGGCSLGARPVDYHIKGFAAIGAEISEKNGFVIASGKPLLGGEVYFDRPSHTGTENLIFGAIHAKRKTVLINAACDPEITDVATFLSRAGAKLYGVGTPQITIEPVRRLQAVDHTVSGDRLMAGTYAFGAALTGGDVEITGIPTQQMTVVIHKLEEMGCTVTAKKTSFRVKGPRRLKPVKVVAFPYPGFPTDLQACALAASTLADGASYIVDTVFPDRFNHTMELRRLGADVTVNAGEAIVNGVTKLQGASVMAPDIRAGAGILLGCLAAHGHSELLRVYHIDRGYYRIEEKLNRLGASIQRENE